MGISEDDPAMLALLYPLQRGLAILPAHADILLVNPRQVQSWPAGDRISAWQWWKDAADALKDPVKTLPPEGPGADEIFDAVLVRLPRQRDEARWAMAAGWRHLRDGGLFMAAAANDAGGARLAGDLTPVLSGLQSVSKHKSRCVWSEKMPGHDLPPDWLENGRLRKDARTGLWTRPGLFSWDRIDAATALLLAHLPVGQGGIFADLGCGAGAITDHLLRHNPAVEKAICVDADARALEACARMAAENHPGRGAEFHWADLSRRWDHAPVDLVVMNPPFHSEKKLAIETGQAFISNAAALLKGGGELFMVANAHLPYEEILRRNFLNIEKRHEGQGFKIFHARKQA